MVCFQAGLIAGLLAMNVSSADQIQMHNGDRYAGRVVSVTTNAIVFQSEVLGTVTLPREKVAQISLGTVAPSNAVARLPVTPPKPAVAAVPAQTPPDLAAQLRQLKSDPNALKQVESEYLSAATPEAKAKFNEMVNGLVTGKLTVGDIRSEAKSAADQLRSAKAELGPEAGDALDAYLAILDNFLRETGSAPAAGGKTAAPAVKSKPSLLDPE